MQDRAAARGGVHARMFSKELSTSTSGSGTGSCPNGLSAAIRRDPRGDGTARFATACAGCTLAGSCTTAKTGRTVAVSRHEARLAAKRRAGQDPG